MKICIKDRMIRKIGNGYMILIPKAFIEHNVLPAEAKYNICIETTEDDRKNGQSVIVQRDPALKGRFDSQFEEYVFAVT